MILGADTQNKNLKDAASKRIDTSPRTETSNKYSATVASSKTSSSGSNSIGSDSTVYSKKPTRSDPVKGSFEGYMHGSATHIQVNNSGYLNPAIQKARYNKVSASGNGASRQLPFTKPGRSSIMNNTTRMSLNDDSSSKIREINKRNNML